MEKAWGYITRKIGEGAQHVAATQGNGVICDLNLAGRPLILEVGTESLVQCFCVLMYQSVGKGKEWGAVFTTNSGYPSNKPASLLTALNPKHSVKIPLSALPSLRHLLNLFLVQASPKCSGSSVSLQVANSKKLGNCQLACSSNLKQS